MRLQDVDAERYLEIHCSSSSSADPSFGCGYDLYDGQNASLLNMPAAQPSGVPFQKETYYTFELRYMGGQQIDLYIDGLLAHSQTFDNTQWNGLNWATPSWNVIAWGGQTVLVDESLDSFGYSNATDSDGPLLTVGGAIPNVWLTSSGAVSVSARDGASAYDGSGLKCLVGQWDAWPTNSHSGCYSTVPLTFSVNQLDARTLYLRAWDWAGNQTSQSYVYKLDTQAPTASTTAASGCAAANDVWQNSCADPAFSWSGASDAHSGLKGYYVYFGPSASGVPAAFTTSPSFDPPPVPSGSVNYLRVQSEDNVGQRSSVVTLFTLRYDNTPPTVPNMSSPPAYSAGSTNSVSWGSVADSGVCGVEYQARRAVNAACSAGAVDSPWLSAATHTFSDLSDGVAYHYCVRSRDGLGNSSAWSASVTSTQDASPPGVPIVTAEPAYTTGSSNSITWSSVADDGVGGVEYQVQQATNSGFSNATASAWQSASSFSASGLTSCQIYYYRVRSRDALGNTAPWSAAVSSTQDAGAPSGSLQINGGAAWTNVGQVTLNLSGSDDCVAASALQLQRQNENGGWEATWQPFSAVKAWNLSSGDGVKTVSVRLRDPAGNISPAASAAITLDSMPPQVPTPTLVPQFFSPNGDGSQDEVAVSAALVESNPVSWRIEVQDASGAVIRTATGSGTNVAWAWDGRDDGGNVVADGAGYAIRVVAADAAANSATGPSVSVGIDTQPTTLVLIHPLRRDLWPDNETFSTNANGLLVEGAVGNASDGVAISVNGGPWQSAAVSGPTNVFAQAVTLDATLNTLTAAPRTAPAISPPKAAPCSTIPARRASSTRRPPAPPPPPSLWSAVSLPPMTAPPWM